MSFPRYPKYKDSGVEWLGEVPEHWESSRVRWLCSRFSGGTPDKSKVEYWENGSIPWLNSGAVNDRVITEPSEWITPAALENSSAKWIPRDALLIALAGQGKTKGMVAQLKFEATCNQSMAALITGRQIKPRFLFWWLDSNYQNIRNMAGGDLRDGLNLELLGDIPCPLPAIAEQHAIASFLDRETAKIDALIAEQQRLIELLQEKRQAVISHAVTKGLNPDAPMKDSGIEWLGEVPAHWEVMKIGRLLVEFPKNGLSPEITNSGTTPTFSIAAVRGGRVDIESHLKYCDVTLDKASPYFVAQGDIFVLRGSGSKDLVGTAGIVLDLPPRNCIYPDILIRLRPSHQLTPWFLVHSLNCPIIRPQIVVAAQTAAGIWKLAGGELREIRIPLPPVAEQVKIESKITIASATMNNLINSAETSLTLLQERRAALISAAVTGQIDVRGLAPKEAV